MSFVSFISTVNPFLPRDFPKNVRLLADINNIPVGIQSSYGGPDGIWVPVDLTAGQIASPSAAMIADLNAVFRLNVSPYTRYISNGTTLVQMGAGSGTGLVTLTQPATGATITIADTKTLTSNNSLTFQGTDSTVQTFPATNGTIATTNIVQAFSAAQFFYGGTNFGNGAGAQLISISGAHGQNRAIGFDSAGSLRWQMGALNDTGTGTNVGDSFFLGAYTDSAVFIGMGLQLDRASGPNNNGPPAISLMAPYTQGSSAACLPAGVYGNNQSLITGDAQPVLNLAANPITTTFPTNPTILTILVSNPVPAGASYGGISSVFTTPTAGPDCWVLLTGATAVGGVTPNGTWMQVLSATTTAITCAWTAGATSAATGGGSAITLQVSFAAQGNKRYTKVTTSADGFSDGDVQLYDAEPLWFRPQSVNSGGPAYQMNWKVVQGPYDKSALNLWGVNAYEIDLCNLGDDFGYAPNLYSIARNTIGIWMGPIQPLIGSQAGLGTAANWNTAFSVFSGENLGLGVYTGFSVQRNGLVATSIDPAGHGGVGTDIFGEYTTLGANPLSTTSGQSTVVLKVLGTIGFGRQANGGLVHIPVASTINGVTLGGGTQQSVTLAANPITTTTGSLLVTVAYANAGLILDSGAVVTLSGATATGGITPNGAMTVLSTTANAFTAPWTAAATGGATGGGSSVVIAHNSPVYVMSAVNTTTGVFTVTGNGTASGTGIGGGNTLQVSFLNKEPYASHQVWGGFTVAGLVAHPSFRSDTGLFVESLVGSGYGWVDPSGAMAQVTASELSAGNMDILLMPAGTGTVHATSPVKLAQYTVATLPAAAAAFKGCMAYITDATTPTYNGTLTGAGTVIVPVFCNGTAWTSH